MGPPSVLPPAFALACYQLARSRIWCDGTRTGRLWRVDAHWHLLWPLAARDLARVWEGLGLHPTDFPLHDATVMASALAAADIIEPGPDGGGLWRLAAPWREGVPTSVRLSQPWGRLVADALA